MRWSGRRVKFLLLVCEGTSATVGKRFAGCAALVQDAESITWTRRWLAHCTFTVAVGRLPRRSAS